ncbi:MAG TPA: hypothetical protein VNL14_16790 [Candidatus Acidoferrales bacterium]|nr:hypothetical protein [Candidatus Acidoferrales bacterium]
MKWMVRVLLDSNGNFYIGMQKAVTPHLSDNLFLQREPEAIEIRKLLEQIAERYKGNGPILEP